MHENNMHLFTIKSVYDGSVYTCNDMGHEHPRHIYTCDFNLRVHQQHIPTSPCISTFILKFIF